MLLIDTICKCRRDFTCVCLFYFSGNKKAVAFLMCCKLRKAKIDFFTLAKMRKTAYTEEVCDGREVVMRDVAVAICGEG